MPLKSRRQLRWMFKNRPAMARRWAKETPNIRNLPDRVPEALGYAKKNALQQRRARGHR